MNMHFRAMVMVFLSAAFVAQANAAESLKVDTQGGYGTDPLRGAD